MNKLAAAGALTLALAVGAALPLSAPAGAAGVVANGRAFALQWCAQCHIVGVNDANYLEMARPHGPDFSAIKGLDAAKLKARFGATHPVMPAFPGTTDQQIDDLVAYIASVQK